MPGCLILRNSPVHICTLVNRFSLSQLLPDFNHACYIHQIQSLKLQYFFVLFESLFCVQLNYSYTIHHELGHHLIVLKSSDSGLGTSPLQPEIKICDPLAVVPRAH